MLSKIKIIFFLIVIFNKIKYKVWEQNSIKDTEKACNYGNKSISWLFYYQSDLYKTIVNHQANIYRHEIWSSQKKQASCTYEDLKKLKKEICSS